jgi:hypothetical protein
VILSCTQKKRRANIDDHPASLPWNCLSVTISLALLEVRELEFQISLRLMCHQFSAHIFGGGDDLLVEADDLR